MSRYVLGLRRQGHHTDETLPFRFAEGALAKVRAASKAGDTVTVILRGGKPINVNTLQRDAGRERREFGG